MTRQSIVERIRHFNRSARPAFLAEFTTIELSDYLRRLEAAPDALAPDDAPAGAHAPLAAEGALALA